MVWFSSWSHFKSCSSPGRGVVTSVTLQVYLQRLRGSTVLQYNREHLENEQRRKCSQPSRANSSASKLISLVGQQPLTDSLSDTASSCLTTALTEHRVSESAESLEVKKIHDQIHQTKAIPYKHTHTPC